MKRYLLTGICGLLLACGAGAGDLNRCRDAQGHVLLTDQPCAEHGMEPDRVATAAVPVGEAEVAEVAATAMAVIPQAEQMLVEPKRSPWAQLPHPLVRRVVALDASTLQAAHATMLMEDEMRRQRKIASAR